MFDWWTEDMCVRGHMKVTFHLTFGGLALTVDQLLCMLLWIRLLQCLIAGLFWQVGVHIPYVFRQVYDRTPH